MESLSRMTPSPVNYINLLIGVFGEFGDLDSLAALAKLLRDTDRFPALRGIEIFITGNFEHNDNWAEMETIVSDYFELLQKRGILWFGYDKDGASARGTDSEDNSESESEGEDD
ncbi:hypothetical protein OBBRIDRAFT_837722 [Obba rivulosa]|uniref:Uncharacterized protein n=1 Tax=Obba rivulosa TaxID=1052685 RepID=A0A8E2AX47_9APHY|nr:hypothetical protein OBBRIDRAFT_837722 [Obba rivulosa]